MATFAGIGAWVLGLMAREGLEGGVSSAAESDLSRDIDYYEQPYDSDSY